MAGSPVMAVFVYISQKRFLYKESPATQWWTFKLRCGQNKVRTMFARGGYSD